MTFGAQPVVEVEDSGGNVVTSSSASVSLSIASGTGTLNCTTNPVTATSGVATFAGCEITGTAGTNFSLSATSTGLTGDTSNTFTITGTLKLVFTTTPGTTNNGVVFSAQPVVKIENSGSAVVTTASAPITLGVATGSGTLNCTTNPVTATAGVATFAGCAITGIAGPYTLSAASTGLTTGTSDELHHQRRLGHPAGVHHVAGQLHQRRGLHRPAGGQGRRRQRQRGHLLERFDLRSPPRRAR